MKHCTKLFNMKYYTYKPLAFNIAPIAVFRSDCVQCCSAGVSKLFRPEENDPCKNAAS